MFRATVATFLDPPTNPGSVAGGSGAALDGSDLRAGVRAGLLARLRDNSFPAWADTAAAVHYCARPVRLSGSSTTLDPATGEVLGTFDSSTAPLGVLYRPCGNRRASVCPACSRTYARDTFALIRAGLAGGKTIPATVADNPLLFATLTAPSFGHVHGPRPLAGNQAGGRCRPRDRTTRCTHGRPTGCMTTHREDDPANGSPICDDCYDWTSAVVWQWWAPELWRRTTIALRRDLAARLGLPPSRLADAASVQFVKVAEYQARGLIHFHVLIRLDGPDGPGSPSPLPGTVLAAALRTAAGRIALTVPGIDDDDPTRDLAWGAQLDVRIVRHGARTDDPTGPLTDEQVAGYLAKYATKDADSIRDRTHPRRHLQRLTDLCRQLAARAREHDQDTPYALLGKWAHMLGFRGHFSSKSRRYSVTLGRLRRARNRYAVLAADARRTGVPLNLADLEARLLADDDDETTLVLSTWTYQGSGWPTTGDTALALAAADAARAYDIARAQTRAA